MEAEGLLTVMVVRWLGILCLTGLPPVSITRAAPKFLTSAGGATLGTNRHSLPANAGIEAVARGLEEYKIGGLLLIGGWDVYSAIIQLKENEDKFPQFKIPVIGVPAAIGCVFASLAIILGDFETTF